MIVTRDKFNSNWNEAILFKHESAEQVSEVYRYRSSRPEVLCKKVVPRNFAKIHRKTLVPESLCA